MDSSANQQAYDRGHTIFSPDGRLYQVEYAREAVERGSPSVGVRTGDGTVLAARKPVRSPLLEPETVEKIHRIDDHVVIASAGHAADARQLVEFARDAAQRHRLRYGEPVGLWTLTKTIADRVQEYTQTGGSRPYGTALLVAGVDGGNLAYSTSSGATTGNSETSSSAGTNGSAETSARTSSSTLFEIDPSGTPYGWRGVAIGNGAGAIRGFLEERLAVDGTVNDGRSDSSERPRTSGRENGSDPLETIDDGIETALEALAVTAENPLEPSELDVYTVPGTADLRRSQIERVLDDRLADVLETVHSSGPAS